MPFRIIRNDITRVAADAIVNTANPNPVIGSGTDNAVYAAAGKDALLAARKKIGRIARGEAAVTPAFGLQAKYIIHTVGPVWRGGGQGEEEKLRACYRKPLLLAEQLECESIAFPLISTGVYGFPKELALKIAEEEITGFLENSEMEITLVVFDRASFEISAARKADISRYIDEHYVADQAAAEYAGKIPPTVSVSHAISGPALNAMPSPAEDVSTVYAQNAMSGPAPGAGHGLEPEASPDAMPDDSDEAAPQGWLEELRREAYLRGRRRRDSGEAELPEESAPMLPAAPYPKPSASGRTAGYAGKAAEKPGSAAETAGKAAEKSGRAAETAGKTAEKPEKAAEAAGKAEKKKSLAALVGRPEEDFKTQLFRLIDERRLSDPEVYKKANITKQVFSKIRSKKEYQPSRNTALALALALELNLDQTTDLLSRAGYAFSPSNKTDIVIRYCIENRIFRLFDVDSYLVSFDLPTISYYGKDDIPGKAG